MQHLLDSIGCRNRALMVLVEIDKANHGLRVLQIQQRLKFTFTRRVVLQFPYEVTVFVKRGLTYRVR
jgi:hypothetical protein